MQFIGHRTALLALASVLVFTACDKDDQGELSGPKPTISFTASTPKIVGLTSEVTFTSTSSDAFLYQWDFGDGTVASGPSVTHVYTKGGTFNVQLIAAGRGGTSPTVSKQVVIVSPLSTVNQLLTGGSSKTWMLDNSVSGTIAVGPNDADPTSYYPGGAAGSLPACQADDEFTFSTGNVYTYNAKTETFVAGTGPDSGCKAPRSSSTPFTFGAATGAGVAQLTLANAGSFIGVTDAPDLVYRILSIDDKHMVLRAGKPTAGVVFTIKLVAK